jgi:transcriptional regulator with XRE-family HTH domain
VYRRRESDIRVDEAMTTIGGLVRYVRVRLGWSQRTLQAYSGVHQSSISRFERGLAPGLRFEAVACMVAALRAQEPIRHRLLAWLEALDRERRDAPRPDDATFITGERALPPRT